MNSVNKTMYIPLYGKAYVSKKGIILSDKKAEEIWNKEGFSLKGKSKSKWLAYFMGMRAAVYDCWAKEQMKENPADLRFPQEALLFSQVPVLIPSRIPNVYILLPRYTSS